MCTTNQTLEKEAGQIQVKVETPDIGPLEDDDTYYRSEQDVLSSGNAELGMVVEGQQVETSGFDVIGSDGLCHKSDGQNSISVEFGEAVEQMRAIQGSCVYSDEAEGISVSVDSRSLETEEEVGTFLLKESTSKGTFGHTQTAADRVGTKVRQISLTEMKGLDNVQVFYCDLKQGEEGLRVSRVAVENPPNQNKDNGHTMQCIADKNMVRGSTPTIENDEDPKNEAFFKCNESSKESETLKSHFLTQSEEKPFECKQCNKRFKNNRALKVHQYMKLKLEPFQCLRCKKCFRASYALVKHIIAHFDEKPFVCHYCSQCFKRPDEVVKHAETHRQDTLFQCKHCEKSFQRSTSLLRHLVLHFEARPYKCQVCGKCYPQSVKFIEHSIHFCKQCGQCFKTRKQFERHNLVKHSKTKMSHKLYKCEYCCRRFLNQKSLAKHRLNNPNSRMQIKCDLCCKRFQKQESLTEHRLTHQCKICSKYIRGPNSLENHLFLHSDENPYKCKQCDKSYSQAGSLESHRRYKHTQERPFKCDQCNKAYKGSTNLHIHKMTHTGIKPHACSLCGKRFQTKAHMRRHQLTHTITEDKPHKCQVCGKGFLEVPTLNRHLLVHSGEKKFECNLCGKRFGRKDNLGMHLRRHFGKTYECDNCGKCYKSPRTLSTHEGSCQKGIRFKCSHCNKCLSSARNLKNHIKRFHPNEAYKITNRSSDSIQATPHTDRLRSKPGRPDKKHSSENSCNAMEEIEGGMNNNIEVNLETKQADFVMSDGRSCGNDFIYHCELKEGEKGPVIRLVRQRRSGDDSNAGKEKEKIPLKFEHPNSDEEEDDTRSSDKVHPNKSEPSGVLIDL